MADTLNLSLTDELRNFINANCGEGTLYATPSEFVRDLLRQKKIQFEAARVRDAIIEGYQDIIAERTVAFKDIDFDSFIKNKVPADSNNKKQRTIKSAKKPVKK